MLEQTLGEVVRRHEALRTTFHSVEGRPVQVVGPASPVVVSFMDLTLLPEAERGAQVERLTLAETRRSFDLARGPLLSTTLVKLTGTEYVVFITTHHIISDGWSVGVMGREMIALFEAFSGGAASPLPEPPIQYADYAAWQHQWLRGPRLEEQLSYWKKRLDGSPPVLTIPADRPRPKVQSFHGDVFEFAVPRPLIEGLEKLSRRENVTMFMMLLAAFQILLGRYARQTDIVVGTNVANRARRETEGLIGFFVNNLVLRASLADNPTALDLLARVREDCLGAFAHQDVPFEKLVDELKPDRNLGYNPLFQTLFVLQNYPSSKMQVPGLTLRPLGVRGSASRFDIMLNMEVIDPGLVGFLEYNTDLFDQSTVSRMAEQYERLLEQIVENPEKRIDSFTLAKQGESMGVIFDFNDDLE